MKDRLRQRVLTEEGQHEKLEVAVGDLVAMGVRCDDPPKAPDPGATTTSVLRERGDQLGP